MTYPQTKRRCLVAGWAACPYPVKRTHMTAPTFRPFRVPFSCVRAGVGLRIYLKLPAWQQRKQNIIAILMYLLYSRYCGQTTWSRHLLKSIFQKVLSDFLCPYTYTFLRRCGQGFKSSSDLYLVLSAYKYNSFLKICIYQKICKTIVNSYMYTFQ